jgi:hypothetical protein
MKAGRKYDFLRTNFDDDDDDDDQHLVFMYFLLLATSEYNFYMTEYNFTNDTNSVYCRIIDTIVAFTSHVQNLFVKGLF